MEVYQSLDIVKKCMDGLPDGPIMHESKPAKLLSLLKEAEGVGQSSIEAPRGDDTHAIKLTKGEENITWWKVRAPTYANAMSWPIMFKDQEIADAPLIINSIDPCISCMERMLVVDEKGSSTMTTKEELIKLCRDKTRRLMHR